jgi:hypothetical protein
MTNREFQGHQGYESVTTHGLAPLALVAKQRRDEPTLELPRLPLPQPLPRDTDYVNRPRETEREPAAPTRGVHVFDMV